MKGRERTAKFYFRNENEVMQDLGLKPAKGSGSGWIDKEDGENEYIIAQLKSTDKQSYTLKQLDIEKLEYNAGVANKVPVFILQFLNNDSRYAMMAIEDIPKVSEYLRTGEVEQAPSESTDLIKGIAQEPKRKRKIKKVKSSSSAREEFYKEKEKSWQERKWNR